MRPSDYPITYRDFHDVPRVLLVWTSQGPFLLDCEFDFDLDDFPAEYQIHRMPHDFAAPEGTWAGITEHAVERLGTVATSAVKFDASRRRSICASYFDGLLAQITRCRTT